MNAVLVDDDQLNNDLLKTLFQKYCPAVTVVGEADSVESAIEMVVKHPTDVIFLDIELHDKTAGDLLKSLNLDNIQIIIISAFEKYALEMHKYPVTDYLLKPVLISDLVSAVNKVQKQMEKNKQPNLLMPQSELCQYIAIPEKDHMSITNLDDIIRFEAQGNYTKIYTQNNKIILSSRTLKEYEDQTSSTQFIRVHASHLVNIKFVSKYTRQKNSTLVLLNGVEVPISASRKKETLNHFI